MATGLDENNYHRRQIGIQRSDDNGELLAMVASSGIE